MEHPMAELTTLLEIAVVVALTGGLAWVASRRPAPVRVRIDDRRR